MTWLWFGDFSYLGVGWQFGCVVCFGLLVLCLVVLVGAFWFRFVDRICLLVIALCLLYRWLGGTVVVGLLAAFVDVGLCGNVGCLRRGCVFSYLCSGSAWFWVLVMRGVA